jgi:adenylate cyclase
MWEDTKNHGKRLLFSSVISQPFRVGRQNGHEAAQLGLIQSPSSESKIEQKLVIAFKDERAYSRHFAEIDFEDANVEIRNTSNKVVLVNGESLYPEETRTVPTPANVTFVNRSLQFESVAQPDKDSSIFSLPRNPDAAPPSNPFYAPTVSLEPNLSIVATATNESGFDSKRLLDLLQTMLQIFQDSPTNQQFFDQATVAMTQLLQLDYVLIAFQNEFKPKFENTDEKKQHGQWYFQAVHRRPEVIASDWHPSSHIIQVVENQKETVYQIPGIRSVSLTPAKCKVASPMLNSKQELTGLIYGEREIAAASTNVFSEAEAKFVELFANGIAFGMERLVQERKISEMRSRFDQFFTPDLARQLESDASLLEPRSARVSVLFADIRGFSRISERIGPAKTIRLINSVMNQLSDCVFRYEGVVVDYIGDEILAMWGAPLDREDHAEMAVRAALEIRLRLPEINAEWESVIGEPVEIGIGINSGEAQVGNIGSDRKFKYGPLGDVVNVSSRLQGATQQLGTKLLVTESTAATLPTEILSRKIRSVRFVNVQRAVNVYEIPLKPDENWIQLKTDYEKGLALYEKGELRAASQQVAVVINRFPEDGPSVHLLSDCVSRLSQSRQEFDPVWTLSQK